MKRSMIIWNAMLGFAALCLLTNCDTVSDSVSDTISNTVSTGKLLGHTATCLEPGNVEKAEASAERGDFAAWRRMNCGGLGFSGVSVRVIRCAANLTPRQMNLFFDPVPLDDGLPDFICEVDLLFEDGSTHIAYTHFLDIERSP